MARSIVLTHFNIDDYYSTIERFLRSLFDCSLSLTRQAIVLENNCSKIVYAKESITTPTTNAAFTMTLTVTKPLICEHSYTISFEGKPFPLRKPVKTIGFEVINLNDFLSTQPTIDQTTN